MRFNFQITNILSFDRPQLAALCLAMNICVLDDCDYLFLKEFKMAMRPIADGLTALEGVICFGAYLPHLFGIQSQLNNLKTKKFRFCTPLLNAIYDGFIERFKDVMDPYNIKPVPLYLSTITNPNYKMNYIGDLRPTILTILTAAEEIVKEDEKGACGRANEDIVQDGLVNEDEGT